MWRRIFQEVGLLGIKARVLLEEPEVQCGWIGLREERVLEDELGRKAGARYRACRPGKELEFYHYYNTKLLADF